MKKLDLFLAAIIGFVNGVFFFFLLKQIGKEVPYSQLLPVVFAILGAIGLFVASEIGKKFSIILQAAKFFLVGTLNTFIDIGVLNIFIWITGIARGVFYTVFKSLSFLVAVINSYFWNKYWTFEKRGEKSKSEEFLKFLLVTFFGFLINVGVASFVVNIIGPQFAMPEKTWASVGAIIAAFFAFTWNFTASKLIVFK